MILGFLIMTKDRNSGFPILDLTALDVSDKRFWPVFPFLYGMSEHKFIDI